jgi:hypothetical protein
MPQDSEIEKAPRNLWDEAARAARTDLELAQFAVFKESAAYQGPSSPLFSPPFSLFS